MEAERPNQTGSATSGPPDGSGLISPETPEQDLRSLPRADQTATRLSGLQGLSGLNAPGQGLNRSDRILTDSQLEAATRHTWQPVLISNKYTIHVNAIYEPE